jgi:hypothetical protein
MPGRRSVGVVDAHGDGVGRGAVGGGARHGDLGDGAGIGLALRGVGGDGHRLAHGDLADVQLVDAHGHLQIGQVIDGAQGLAGLHRVAGLVLLVDDGAGDGGFDGVVVQLVLGVLHGELRVGAGCPGRSADLVGEVLAGEGDNGLVLGDGLEPSLALTADTVPEAEAVAVP